MNTADLIKDLRYNSDTFSKEFAALLVKEHRTHQASVIKNLQTILKLYGETATTDQRNEAAAHYARQTAKIDVYIPYI